MRRLLRYVALVLVLLLSGCWGHKDIGVTFENHTKQDLFMDINGGGYERVAAGRTATIGHRLSDDKRSEIEVTVKTQRGDVVYHKVFQDQQEFKDAGGRIVLEEPLVTPP
jgi:hypothetical protein